MDFIWSQYSKSWNLFHCSVQFFYGLLFNWGRVFNYKHQNTSSLHQNGRPDWLALAKVFSVKTSRCSTSPICEIRASIFSTYVWFEKKTIRLWVPKKVTLSYFAPHIGNLVGRPPKICIFLRNLHNFNNKVLWSHALKVFLQDLPRKFFNFDGFLFKGGKVFLDHRCNQTQMSG